MTGLRIAFCGLALLMASCAVSSDPPATEASAQEVTNQPEIMIPRALKFEPADEENCTDTFGQCKIGQCELGPHDTFQRITEVCCDASGANCTTELYRECGC